MNPRPWRRRAERADIPPNIQRSSCGRLRTLPAGVRVNEPRPYSFKQRDLTRALRAAEAAGIKTYRVEINDNGKRVVIVGIELDKPKKEAVAS